MLQDIHLELEKNLRIGSRIYVTVFGEDQPGTVKWIGYPMFAKTARTPWLGIETDFPVRESAHTGHMGFVNNHYYFTCPRGHGVLAPESMVQRILPNDPNFCRRKTWGNPTATDVIKRKQTEEANRYEGRIARAAPGSNAFDGRKVSVGRPIVVNRVGFPTDVHDFPGPVTGTVRWIGYPPWAKEGACEWVGVEFEDPVGNCDGMLRSFYFFSCKPRHGAIVPLSDTRRPEADDLRSYGRKPPPRLTRPAWEPVWRPNERL